MQKLLAGWLFFGSALSACATASDPLGKVGPGSLAIEPEKSSYTWSEASADGIRGTIRNTSDRILYSKIGDAFLISVDQDPLLIANFSDGAVERQVAADSWARVPTLYSIEGVRFVVLRPGQTYHFLGQVSGTPQVGTYRVAISYRTSINDEQPSASFTDHSATFTVR